MEAQALWVLWPGEIAADLRRVYGVRIADWHQERMSSYEFMELIHYLPDDSLYKTGWRRGEPCERDQWARQTANETSVLRAGMVPGADADTYDARLFLPKHKLDELTAVQAEAASVRESIYAMVPTVGG